MKNQPSSETVLRLQKLMAARGVASRRASEELIEKGKVKVNGQTEKTLGTKVDIKKDVVSVRGRIISQPGDYQQLKSGARPNLPSSQDQDSLPAKNEPVMLAGRAVYILLNKPSGYVTTAKDELGRKTVMDLIKDAPGERLFAVGRLDQDTSGLLIMTNDGQLANHLTHPRYEVEKTYVAIVGGGEWTAKEIERFESGLRLGKKAKQLTAPAEIKLLERRKDGTRKVEIKVREGQNHQVKRMCKAVNHPVVWLERTAMAGVKLGDLRRGKWRELSPAELQSLQK